MVSNINVVNFKTILVGLFEPKELHHHELPSTLLPNLPLLHNPPYVITIHRIKIHWFRVVNWCANHIWEIWIVHQVSDFILPPCSYCLLIVFYYSWMTQLGTSHISFMITLWIIPFFRWLKHDFSNLTLVYKLYTPTQWCNSVTQPSKPSTWAWSGEDTLSIYCCGGGSFRN